MFETDGLEAHLEAAAADDDEARAFAVDGAARIEALVWAANLAHGGAPILDPALTWRSLVTHFFFEDRLYYTPMRSDEASGRLALRLPADVAAGGVRWPRRDGRGCGRACARRRGRRASSCCAAGCWAEAPGGPAPRASRQAWSLRRMKSRTRG